MNTEPSIAQKIAKRLTVNEDYLPTAELAVKEELQPMIEIMENILAKSPTIYWNKNDWDEAHEFVKQNKL